MGGSLMEEGRGVMMLQMRWRALCVLLALLAVCVLESGRMSVWGQRNKIRTGKVVDDGYVFSAAEMYMSRLGEGSLAKLKEMETMLQNAGGEPVLRMNWEKYLKLVLKRPAPYHLFVLYGTNDTTCRKCGMVYEAFREAARSFQVMNRLGMRRLSEFDLNLKEVDDAENPIALEKGDKKHFNGGRSEKIDFFFEKEEEDADETDIRSVLDNLNRFSEGYVAAASINESALPIYFVYVDIYENQEVPAIHQIKNVPVLYSTKGAIMKAPFTPDKMSVPFVRSDTLPALTIYEHAKAMRFLAQIFVSWMNTYIDEISSTTPPVVLATRQGEGLRGTIKLTGTVFFFFAAVIILLVLFYEILVRKMIEYPFIMPILAWIAFTLCSCGFVHTYKMSAGFFSKDPSSKLSIFDRSGRSQTIGEGVIVAFLSAAVTPFVILMFYRQRTIKLRQKNATLFQPIFLMLVALTILCFYFLLTAYRLKSGWYAPSFLPPLDYMRGPISRDRHSLIQH